MKLLFLSALPECWDYMLAIHSNSSKVLKTIIKAFHILDDIVQPPIGCVHLHQLKKSMRFTDAPACGFSLQELTVFGHFLPGF